MSTSAVTKRLVGKIAVVTASTEGIGYAIAKRLAEDGAKVVISSRKEAKVKNALASLQALNLDVTGTVCHVAKAEDRKRLVDLALKQYGGIDILISNAGTNPVFGPILDTSEEVFDKMFETNVKPAFLLTKEIAPHMEKRKRASIVLVSSIVGYQPMEMLGIYSVSKTALLGLTKALAPQCARMGIRVNCIAPGIIETKFSDALINNEELTKQVLNMTPLKRFGTSEDCANVVSFLCSDDAAYITGETIAITGGMPSRL